MIRTKANMIIHQSIFFHHLHPHIQHGNHHNITHRLIFLNHHYYAPLHQSMNLKLVLFRYNSATKRSPTLHDDIKSST